MANLVQIERHGDLAVVEINHPPHNALSAAVRQALLAAIREATTDPAIHGVVLAGAGRGFVAGSETAELDAPPAGPTMAEICALLDASAKPVVAALHGVALGEGFELALACHARVMAPDGLVGLPEVRLGLIPGAGGTQRLPRLVGAMAALDIVTSGRHVAADEAAKLGIADEIATDVRAQAMARAHALAAAGHWQVLSRIAPPATDRAAFDAAAKAIARRARGALAPPAAATAIAWALDLPFPEACAREAAQAAELRAGPQTRALRHIYHADRVAARAPAGAGAAWPIKHVGVIGGGTMGAGITVSLLEAGYKVTLVETSLSAAAAAEARIRAVHARQIGAGRLSPDVVDERLRRLAYSYHYGRLTDADLVIEAIYENLEAKQEVFRNLSPAVRRDCILASNTSRLDINLLADMVDAPERVLGLHFFSPAHVMRLLEIVRGDRTSPEVIATALAFAQRIRKQPVISGVTDGFIGNRILSRWWAQCDFALEDGAYPEEVDAAVEAAGFAMGPYAVADLAGLDIAWAGRKATAATRDPQARPPQTRDVKIIDWLCEQGRFGQKTGAGWYRHEGRNRVTDPAVHALVDRASAERGITRRKIAPEEIQARILAAMVNEAAKILQEGIAQRPSDIDVTLVHGYGYPAWRGGPMHEADQIGLKTILETVHRMSNDGPAFAPAPLLVELATTGRSFASLNP